MTLKSLAQASAVLAGVTMAGLSQATFAADLFGPAATRPTGSYPEAVAVGDVNGDGRNDVVLTTSYYFDPENDYKLFVFLQDPQGQLSSPLKYATQGTYPNPPKTVDIGDVNGDGLNDVIIGNAGSNIQIFTQNAAGGLDSSQVLSTPYSHKIRIADLNGDGRMDITGIGWGGSEAGVFLQDAAGTVSLSAAYYAPHGGYDDLEVGDVNDDGRSDIVVMSGQGYAYDNLAVLLQNATGTFDSVNYYDLGGDELSSGVGVGDVNGDGKNDVVFSYGGNRPYSNIAVFGQNDSGTLDPAVSASSYDVPGPLEVADVDGDGRGDIVVVHDGWNAMGVYLQQADGSIGTETLYPIPYASWHNPHGLALGDINSDGTPDAVIANYNEGLVVLYNSAGPANVSPVADAGPDTSVTRRTTITLDGTASHDPDGSIVDYSWTQMTGPAVTLVPTASPGVVTFEAPNVTIATELVFQLTVTDDRGATATDQVVVTVLKK